MATLQRKTHEFAKKFDGEYASLIDRIRKGGHVVVKTGDGEGVTFDDKGPSMMIIGGVPVFRGEDAFKEAAKPWSKKKLEETLTAAGEVEVEVFIDFKSLRAAMKGLFGIKLPKKGKRALTECLLPDLAEPTLSLFQQVLDTEAKASVRLKAGRKRRKVAMAELEKIKAQLAVKVGSISKKKPVKIRIGASVPAAEAASA